MKIFQSNILYVFLFGFFLLDISLDIVTSTYKGDYGEYLSHDYNEYLTMSGKSIIDLVDRSEKVVFLPKENTPYCKSNNVFGYVDYPYLDNGNYFSNLAICTNRILRYRNNFSERQEEIDKTLNHEALHAAQLCHPPSSDFLPFGIRNGMFSNKIHANLSSEIYRDLSPTGKLVELEAFYVEDRPHLVKQYLIKHCY